MSAYDTTVYASPGKVEEYRGYLLEAIPIARDDAIIAATDLARYLSRRGMGTGKKPEKLEDFSFAPQGGEQSQSSNPIDESLNRYLKARQYVTAIEDALMLLENDGT